MFCKKCGKSLPEGAVFCSCCGTSQTEDLQNDTKTSVININQDTRFVPGTCTNCGASLQVNPNLKSAICPACGTPYIVQHAINNFNIHSTGNISIENAVIMKPTIVLQDKSNSIDKGDVFFAPVEPQKPENPTSTQGNSTKKGTIGGIIAFILLVLVVRSCLFGGGNSSSQTTSEAPTTVPERMYYIILNVECEGNPLLQKCDVCVLLDNENAGTIEKGALKTFTGHVTMGKHSLDFVVSGNESVYGKCDIEVSEPMTLNCKIGCDGNHVEIKSLESHSLCNGIAQDITEVTSEAEFSEVVDFPNVEDFEVAINAGEDLTGKTVTFDVLAYKPNSALGPNIWGGEHLNFISETNPGVTEGDEITVRVTGVRRLDNVSWIITYIIVNQ